MIKLTRLDGREFVLNSELIESFEATPETVLTLTVDKRIVVRESVDEILERITQFKRLVFSDWPVKKDIRIPSSDNKFDWIETDGIIAVEKLDRDKLEEYENAMESSPYADTTQKIPHQKE